jgi:single-strand DNA-binding protein
MRGGNQIVVYGHLGNDPDSKYLDSGKQITSFNVASDNGKTSDGQSKGTTWFRCTCFGKTAEVATEYLSKGSAVIVSGSASLREYTTKDGEKRSSLEVAVNNLVLAGAKNDGTNGGTHRPASAAATDDTSTPIDDLPF